MCYVCVCVLKTKLCVCVTDISSATSMTLEDVYETLAQQSMIFVREPTPPPIKPIPGQAIRIPKNRRNGSHPASSLRRSKSSSTPNQLHKAHRYKSKDSPVGGGGGGVVVNGAGHDHGREGDDGNGPFVLPKHYEVRFDREKVKGFLRGWESKGYLTLKPEKLQWTPYFLTRAAAGNEENKGKVKVNGVSSSGSNGKMTTETEAVETEMLLANGHTDEKVTVSPVQSEQGQQQEDEAEDED